jgi:hypothetical protein
MRALIAAVIAGTGSCALMGYAWWSARQGPSNLNLPAALLALLVIGVVAGAASGRYRDSVVSLAAALGGVAVAYQANYAFDPGWPRSETPFEVWVVYAALFLLPWIVGGHLFGVTAERRITARSLAR